MIRPSRPTRQIPSVVAVLGCHRVETAIYKANARWIEMLERRQPSATYYPERGNACRFKLSSNRSRLIAWPAMAPCPAAMIIWQFAGVTHPAA